MWASKVLRWKIVIKAWMRLCDDVRRCATCSLRSGVSAMLSNSERHKIPSRRSLADESGIRVASPDRMIKAFWCILMHFDAFCRFLRFLEWQTALGRTGPLRLRLLMRSRGDVRPFFVVSTWAESLWHASNIDSGLTMIQWCTIFVLQSMDPLDSEKAQSCIRTNREHGDMVMVGSSCGSCSRSRRCPKSSVWSSVWQERISCAMWVCPSMQRIAMRCSGCLVGVGSVVPRHLLDSIATWRMVGRGKRTLYRIPQ